MSIQTELTRITNAKAAIKAAIEGKGVTVPDATRLDGMAALIEEIEAGGGGGDFTLGEFTLAANTMSYILAEDIDEPTFIVVYKVENITDDDYSFVILAYLKTGGKYYHVGLRNTSPPKALNSIYASGMSTSGAMYWYNRKIVVSAFSYIMIAGTYKYIII